MSDAFSALESVGFAVLLSLSAYLFVRRLLPVIRTIRASRPEAGFRLRPVTPRIRAFIREVLLQKKVIRERPLAGLAHALVFWGFCAFGLVTADHLAAGFGFRVLASGSAFSRFYSVLAGVFAAAVAVSISGLALRRFIARPRWLGEVSAESGLIAGLIFILMATYLAGFLAGETGMAAKLNWWIHTLALLVFLPVIPHTKHLHLLLSPFTVFLRRESFGTVPPLERDDDFGLETGREVTRIVALQAFSCVECGRCSQHCPATNTGKALDPKQIVLGVRGYLKEHGAEGGAPLLGTHIAQEDVFQCTTCGSCEYQCPVGIQHLPMLIGLRRGAVNTGRWEDEHGTRLFLNLERSGNALGLPASQRDSFLKKHALPLFDGSQDYCLWLGCMGSYDPGGRETVLAVVRLLEYLGISFGVLEKERCSGDPARRLGNDLVFLELARYNLERMEAAGVKKVLSICPHCVRTIREDWREAGTPPAVEHHSELLARYAGRLPATRGKSGAVFHDPCYLGRYEGVFEAPRRLAALGGPVVEPPRTRQRSFCCGAGGGLSFLGEEQGSRISLARAEELAAAGAPVVAVACPFCRMMLQDALQTISAAPPRLLDIAQIAAAGLPDGGRGTRKALPAPV